MILEEFRRKKVSGGEAVLFSHVRRVAFFLFVVSVHGFDAYGEGFSYNVDTW